MNTVTISLSAGKKGKNSTNSPVGFQKLVNKALNKIVAAPPGTYWATFTSGQLKSGQRASGKGLSPQDIIINKPPT